MPAHSNSVVARTPVCNVTSGEYVDTDGSRRYYLNFKVPARYSRRFMVRVKMQRRGAAAGTASAQQAPQLGENRRPEPIEALITISDLQGEVPDEAIKVNFGVSTRDVLGILLRARLEGRAAAATQLPV